MAISSTPTRLNKAASGSKMLGILGLDATKIPKEPMRNVKAPKSPEYRLVSVIPSGRFIVVT